jgi:hypothetical protein
MNGDAFVLEQGAKTLTDVFVFPRHQPLGDIDHRYLAAEATHRLGEFAPNVAPANHQQMLGNYVELECSTCVSGCASARPGIAPSAACVPVRTIPSVPRS